jgi:hypothetical protein
MPRYTITRNEGGVAGIDSAEGILPPRPAKQAPEPTSHRTAPLDSALTEGASLVDTPTDPRPEIPSKRTVLPPPRRVIVRNEDGSVEVEGGPGPTSSSGFDDFVADPFGELPDLDGELDDAAPPEGGPEDEAEDADADLDVSDYNTELAAELDTPAPKPEIVTTAGHACPDCDFVAATKGGLTKHARRHAL